MNKIIAAFIFLILAPIVQATEQQDIFNNIKEQLLSRTSDAFGMEYDSDEQIVDIQIANIPYSKRKRNNDEYLPLFTETCDNIAYSGVVENQAIAILEDVRDFVEQTTDPVVNINKFDAGIFLYSLSKCFPQVTKDRFSGSCGTEVTDGSGNSKSVNTGSPCFVDQFIDAISEIDEFVSGSVGYIGSVVGSSGITAEIKTNTDKAPNIASKAIEKSINDGWFDATTQCIYNEKEKILKKLHSLFERNYRVKTSLIQSINNSCYVPLRKKGDPRTWDEIFDMQAELMGKEKLEVSKYITESKTSSAVGSKLRSEGFGTCIDGFSMIGGCLTKEQELKLAGLSEKTEYKIADYSPLKAYKITRHFFEASTLKTEYATSPVFSTVIGNSVPSNCNEAGCQPIAIQATPSLSPTTKFELDYRRLRDTFGISPISQLSEYIDDIFYEIFQRKAHVKLDGGDLVGVTIPTQNPFDVELVQETKPLSDRFIIIKTLSGRALTVTNKYSYEERGRITDFYRSVVEALFLNSPDDRQQDLAAYKSAFVITEADFDIFKAAIAGLITDNSQMGQIIGNKNVISEYAANNNANKELGVLQGFAWQEIMRTIFATAQTPSIYYEVSNKLDYEIVSRVKDYTIPLNFGHRNDFLKVRRFFQALKMRYSAFDIENTINARGLDIQDTVKVGLGERELLNMAESATMDGVMDYINRIQKKNEVLDTDLINFRE